MSKKSDEIAEKLKTFFKEFEDEAMTGYRDFAWGVYQISLMSGKSHQEAYEKMEKKTYAMIEEGIEDNLARLGISHKSKDGKK